MTTIISSDLVVTAENLFRKLSGFQTTFWTRTPINGRDKKKRNKFSILCCKYFY